ncbi:hypothetical protein [Oscillatoria sp. FACHB-1407]|nr:hypothetical protein [Oscillatoria sp. FACHB-1407]
MSAISGDQELQVMAERGLWCLRGCVLVESHAFELEAIAGFR